jgi:hypothetical protein
LVSKIWSGLLQLKVRVLKWHAMANFDHISVPSWTPHQIKYKISEFKYK